MGGGLTAAGEGVRAVGKGRGRAVGEGLAVVETHPALLLRT